MDAAIYARYSSSKQREESIEDQVRVCREVANRAGDTIVKVYADSAMSGTTDARPEFRRMIADAPKGAWSRVYVYKLDRFARNRYDSATNKARLRKAGVELVSATESIPDGPDGILLESLYEGMAEYYSANLAQNVRRGMDGNAARCMSNGTSIYGYRRGEDGRFVVVDDEAAVVRIMFAAYVAGRTMTEICRDELAPYRTRRGNKFTPQLLTKMLRNERYAGVYLYNGSRVEGGMPQIIDKDTWEATQSRLERRSKRRSTDTAGFPLTGLLVDSVGRRLYGTTGTGKAGKTYRYYFNRESGLYIPAQPLEDAVVAAIDAALDPQSRAAVVDAVMAAADDGDDDEVAAAEAAEKALAAARRRRSNVIDIMVETGKTAELLDRLAALDAEIADLESSVADVTRSAPVIDRDLVEFFLIDKCRARDAGALAPSLVSRIVLDEDGRSGVIEFSLLEGYMQIHRDSMHTSVFGSIQNCPETKTPPEVGGCSDDSVLVERCVYNQNSHRIVCIPGGFGVRFAA